MKYKIICVFTVFLLIFIAFYFQSIEFQANRYHQHKEAVSKSECLTHDESKFCTHLPLLSIVTDKPMPDAYIINTDGTRIVNDEMVSAKVQYFDDELNNNHLSDEPLIFENAMVRIRGASSRSFDKKGYYLKFKLDDMINNKNISLSGMVADSDWVLHGPFLDKTLIRNYLCYNLAGEIMEYSPNVRFCELFLNDEYQGVYVLTEKIGYNKDGRINITKTDSDINQTSYILQRDRGTLDTRYQINTFGSYSDSTGMKDRNSGQFEIIYPSSTLTENQRQFIENDISKFEKALYSFDYNDKNLGYKNYIDMNSFIDYFIITEFTLNYDSMDLSTYLYKDIRGKLKFAVWDFNSAFDNYMDSVTEPHSFYSTNRFWYNFLLKDEDFVNAVVQRYKILRKSYLSDDYLLNYIDETVAYLGPAIDRNYEKWGYIFSSENDMLIPSIRNPRNYEDSIKQLKDCIIERGRFMDENIELLYSLCHNSTNKKYNHKVKGK